MRSTPAYRIARVAALSGALLFHGCQTVDFLTDNCKSEFINVTWPATITRGSVTTNVTLSGSVAPGNIDPITFDLMREVLVTGSTDILTNVIWTVPAFEVNGGYIAFQHPAPLSSGQTEPVNFAFDGGGWGIVPSGRALPPVIAVRADNFTATAATGSILAVSGRPLRLRIDVTAQNATGATMRLTGDAQFEYREVRSNCS